MTFLEVFLGITIIFIVVSIVIAPGVFIFNRLTEAENPIIAIVSLMVYIIALISAFVTFLP